VSTFGSGSVVTPEAVQLDFSLGGLATRTLAKVVDLGIMAAFAIACLVALAYTGMLRGTVGVISVSLLVFVTLLVVPAVTEAVWNGRTPGKKLLGLRVLTTEGGPIGFRHSLIRCLIQWVEIPLGIALLVAITNPRSQRVGDLAAGTFVIKERDASARVVATAFLPPPGLEAYCSVLDVGRITSEQFLFIRNFLLRVTELDGASRFNLANRLASTVVTRVSPAPPNGVPAEFFLVGVCAVYQARVGTFDGR